MNSTRMLTSSALGMSVPPPKLRLKTGGFRLCIDGGLHRIEPCQLHCQHRMLRLRLDEIPKRFDYVLLHGVRRNA